MLVNIANQLKKRLSTVSVYKVDGLFENFCQVAVGDPQRLHKVQFQKKDNRKCLEEANLETEIRLVTSCGWGREDVGSDC